MLHDFLLYVSSCLSCMPNSFFGSISANVANGAPTGLSKSSVADPDPGSKKSTKSRECHTKIYQITELKNTFVSAHI